jgi:hypothetical protein
LKKLQRDIPTYLADGEEADPAERPPAPVLRPRRLLAASLATAIVGGGIAYLVMERASSPGESAPAASAAARDELAAPTTEELKPEPSPARQAAKEERFGSDQKSAAAEAEAEPEAEADSMKAIGSVDAAPAPLSNETAMGPVRTSSVLEEPTEPAAVAFADEEAVAAAEPPAAAQPPPTPRVEGEDRETRPQAVELRRRLEERRAPAAVPAPAAPAEAKSLPETSLRADRDSSTDSEPDDRPASEAYRASGARSLAGAPGRGAEMANPSSYDLTAISLDEGRLPPPDKIVVEDFVAAFDDEDLGRLAAELARILGREGEGRVADLQNLLDRLAGHESPPAARGALRDLRDLARRAADILEETGAEPSE